MTTPLPAESQTLPAPTRLPSRLGNLIPRPANVVPGEGQFTLSSQTTIRVEPATPELLAIGEYLAGLLRPATGLPLPVSAAAGTPGTGEILLTTAAGSLAQGEEGYKLQVTPAGVTLAAYQPAGLSRGVQTLRQLLPPEIESRTQQAAEWILPAGEIYDSPRFAWRGAMLDVSRHFFPMEVVKRYIDRIAAYKMNVLHLHLSDDQGWRIMINSWPRLAEYGGTLQIGGGQGGYYTQEQYADLVAYAQSRYITIVPEIDMPGHTNAALASYPELNCSGKAPELYTGMEVGFSTLCIGEPVTYQFVDDVVRELAALTPGPYIHIGGDETEATAPDDYVEFIEKVQEIVQKHGKKVIGWEEIAQARLLRSSVAQHWNIKPEFSINARRAVDQGVKLVLSPADKVYLDMKYTPQTMLGLEWAAYIEVKDAYDWEPAALVGGASEKDILGVEAPLWSETLQTLDDIEYLAFPRLIGIAEIGWSPAEGKSWDEYRQRLGAHGPRLEAAEVNFYPSPQVPWEASPAE